MPADLELLIRARYPLIWLRTLEEDRAVDLICRAARALGDAATGWSQVHGLHDVPGPASSGAQSDPLGALAHIRGQKRRTIWILKDLPALCAGGNPALVRAIKDAALHCKTVGAVLVAVGPGDLPPTLEGVAAVHDLALPEVAEHMALLQRVARQLALPVPDAVARALAHACLGLTLEQAENIWARVRVSGGKFTAADVQIVLEEKARIVRSSGFLEVVSSVPMEHVGGLDTLKQWVMRRGRGFSEEARRIGLPFPRGALLVGVQGCGKSLVARGIAGQWGQPLLRMDVGALMEGLVGASETNLRRAIRLAERIAPCVLWVDEIEKAFGATNGATDGGTSLRMLGTLLTWLQEKTQPVFVLATANNIDALPPELLRKGRFDEIFFVDLPEPAQRRDIWRVHLGQRARASDDPGLLDRVDVGALAELSDGYSGAEIAAAVVEGAFCALADGAPPDGRHFAEALRASPPLSKLRAESIDALRAWAEGRARKAG